MKLGRFLRLGICSRFLASGVRLLLMLGFFLPVRIFAEERQDTLKALAIAPFESEDLVSVAIRHLIAEDLERNGEIVLLPDSRQPERLTHDRQPDLSLWVGLGQSYLVTGLVETSQSPLDKHLKIDLYDLAKGQLMLEIALPFREGDERHVAHRASDQIYRALTGAFGTFNTRLAYVLAEGRGPEARYKLIVSDSDGEDARVVASSIEPILSPSWSPDGHRMAYVSFEEGSSAIFVQDLATGSRRRLAAFEGINGAPAWSPDGTEIAMALSKEGSPDIYIMDVASGVLHRVTREDALDTEPSWSPDGKSLLFTSDRGGSPQIYRIDAQGGDAERMTFDGAYNASAIYAPDGRNIVMMHGGDCGYCIALMNVTSRQIKTISKGHQDGSPSFSPSGREILFVHQTEVGAVLIRLSVDGQRTRVLKTAGGDVRAASWSP